MYKDCTVNVDGRAYCEPFTLKGHPVKVRLCMGVVAAVWEEGAKVCAHPMGTSTRVVINPEH